MTDVGVPAAQRRLPFVFRAHGGAGRLVLPGLPIGRYLDIERLELELADVSVEEPEDAPAERFQKRRTQLGRLTVKIGPEALALRVEATRRQLAALGISQVSARFGDGFVSVRARIADGLAVADLSFRVHIATSGALLRLLAGSIRVHGHLPLPGPLVADRILSALLAVGEGERERRPVPRGLGDLEIDLVGGLLWQLLPPSGWRLPKTSGIELAALRMSRAGIEVSYAPLGARSDAEIGVGALAIQLATAHDLMHTADEQLREGQIEEAMRGYRSLLASGGPDQPIVLGRILSLAITRSAWFYDGVELARQALARWPHYAPAHAALAGILLAQGDAREAANHLHALAKLASGEGDDDEATLAALAGARLLRVLDPRASTALYQLALEHDPGSVESAEALADRLTDEARWPELVRLLRARAVTSAPERAVQLRLRLAEVLARELADEAAAAAEVAAARALSPEDPAVHEMAASLREAAGDLGGALDAWHTVIELAQRRGEAADRRTEARAWARVGSLALAEARDEDEGGVDAGALSPEASWRRALELYPAEPEALGGLGRAHRERGEHAAAIALYERVRGAGLPLHIAAHFELEMARCLIDIGREDDARAALRRAAVGRTETAAEAHALLADISSHTDPHHAAAELDTAIASLVDLAEGAFAVEGHRLFRRAAQLAVARADLLGRQGDDDAATTDLQRAHFLSANHDAQVARQAARALLDRAGDDSAAERRWLDAVLATEPEPADKARLLMRSATARRRQSPPDAGTALAEVREASRLAVDPELRRQAFELEAELLSDLGNQRARATALSSLAELTTSPAERMAAEVAAAAAWLSADDAAAALPHAAAAAAIGDQPEINAAPALRRHVLSTFGEAAWRQRAWPDVVRAYSELVGDTPPGSTERVGYLLRIAVASDKRGDAAVAKQSVLAILDGDRPASPSAVLAELRGSALRLLSDMADKSGDGPGSAAALEKLAAANAGEATPLSRAEALYRAGELYRRASRLEDAVRCLEAALRIADSHLPALDALELAWRERGDLERVAVVLGRKVAATRQPARQKPLLVRLGDLQAQLGRPDVARATHRRALDIDASWRPSLRFLAQADARQGQLAAAARTYVQLAGALDSDTSIAGEEVERDRRAAALALIDLLPALEAAEDIAAAIAAIAQHRELPEVAAALREIEGASEDSEPSSARARTASEDDDAADGDEAGEDDDDGDDGAGEEDEATGERARAAPDFGSRGEITHAGPMRRGRLRTASPTGRARARAAGSSGGILLPRAARPGREEPTATHRGNDHRATAEQFRASGRLAKQRGDLPAALAALETAQHLSPHDPALLAELIEVARAHGDLPATARHLRALARLLPAGPRRADALIELADLCYDHLDDAKAARAAMLDAAAALGATARGEATLRMVANEAATNLAWHTAVTALERIAPERRSTSDVLQLATALCRAGRDAAALEMAHAARARMGALGEDLVAQLVIGQATKQGIAEELEAKAATLSDDEARPLYAEAEALYRDAVGDDEAAARVRARLAELTPEGSAEGGGEDGIEAAAGGSIEGGIAVEPAAGAAARPRRRPDLDEDGESPRDYPDSQRFRFGAGTDAGIDEDDEDGEDDEDLDGGETGDLIDGGETGDLIDGGETGDLIDGGETGELIDGGETGDLIDGGETGELRAVTAPAGMREAEPSSGVPAQGELVSEPLSAPLSSAILRPPADLDDLDRTSDADATAARRSPDDIDDEDALNDVLHGDDEAAAGESADEEETGDTELDERTGEAPPAERPTDVRRAVPVPLAADGDVTGRISTAGLVGADLLTNFDDEEEVTGRLASTELLLADLNAAAATAEQREGLASLRDVAAATSPTTTGAPDDEAAGDDEARFEAKITDRLPASPSRPPLSLEPPEMLTATHLATVALGDAVDHAEPTSGPLPSDRDADISSGVASEELDEQRTSRLPAIPGAIHGAARPQRPTPPAAWAVLARAGMRQEEALVDEPEAPAAPDPTPAGSGVDLLAATVELAGRGRARTITSALAAVAREQAPQPPAGPPRKSPPPRRSRASAETRREAASLFRLANAELARTKLDAATTLLARAHDLDPGYAPVFLPLAERLAATGDLAGAHRLLLEAAITPELPEGRRKWARARAETLGERLPPEIRAAQRARAEERAQAAAEKAAADAAEKAAAAAQLAAQAQAIEIPSPTGSTGSIEPSSEASPHASNGASAQVAADAAVAAEPDAVPTSPYDSGLTTGVFDTSRAATVPGDVTAPGFESSRAATVPGDAYYAGRAALVTEDDGEDYASVSLTPEERHAASAERRVAAEAPAMPTAARAARRFAAPSLDAFDSLDLEGGLAEPPPGPWNENDERRTIPLTAERPATDSDPEVLTEATSLGAVYELVAAGNLPAAIALAEKAAAEAEASASASSNGAAASRDLTALELLEELYLESDDGNAAAEVIGRQIALTEDGPARAQLWRRRARTYRELGREQQAYRALKEAHAADPEHPDHGYELRCAAMARREWGLAVTLLLREIDAAPDDRERAALHFELGLIYDERQGEADLAVHHYERALDLDPTIPAVDPPLARRYEAQGRLREAAIHFQRAKNRGVLPAGEPATAALALAPTSPPVDPSAPSAFSAAFASLPEEARGAADEPAGAPPARPSRPPDGHDEATRSDATGDDGAGASDSPPPAARASGRLPLLAAVPTDFAEYPRLSASFDAVEPHIDDIPEEDPPPSPPPDIPALEDALEAAKAGGDRSEILAAGRRLWQLSPGNAVAFAALANEHTANGDLESLIELTAVRAAMTAESSGRASLWIDVAHLAEELGEESQAARAYDLALIEDPSSPIALDARASLAFRLGDFATAEMIYRDIEPADSILPVDELMLRRSVIAEHSSQSAEALTYAQAAAAAAPGRIDLQRRVQELATRAGDLATALPAARAVMALVPIDQEEELLASHFALVGLLHAIGDHAGAIANLERLRREHPGSRDVIAALASVHADRGDWAAACQYLYMLVPLAASVRERALRLFELGEVFLTKVGDLERADDAFLRASDLDPGCVPALRRLIDSYWRADQLGPVLDISTDLAGRGALFEPEMDPASLGRASVAAAIAEDIPLATQILAALGADAAGSVASALIELVGRDQKLTVANACRALRALHDRGVIDMHALVAGAEHPEVRRALQQAAPPTPSS